MKVAHTASSIIDTAKHAVKESTIHLPVFEAYLFGSWAYGDPDEASDIDVALIVEEPVDYQAELEASMAAKRIDPVLELFVVSRAEYHRGRRAIFHDIHTRGIRLV